jgi:hypothetical protein
MCILSAFGPDPIPYPKREFINEEDNDTKSNKVGLFQYDWIIFSFYLYWLQKFKENSRVCKYDYIPRDKLVPHEAHGTATSCIK